MNDPDDLTSLAACVRALEGAEAIYREGGGFSRVRDVATGPGGVKARVELVPTPGLYNARRPSWSVMAGSSSSATSP